MLDLEVEVEALHNVDVGGFKFVANIQGLALDHHIVVIADSPEELREAYKDAVHDLTWSPTLRH